MEKIKHPPNGGCFLSPCGFSPLCFKFRNKKSTIRWIFIKLWCEQSTSPCWTHGSPRNPAGSRPFALNSATKNPPFGGFLSNFGASKVLRLRLASQPCGFEPLCIKIATKKSTIRWIFIKLWCEQRGSNPRPQPWQGCALAN